MKFVTGLGLAAVAVTATNADTLRNLRSADSQVLDLGTKGDSDSLFRSPGNDQAREKTLIAGKDSDAVNTGSRIDDLAWLFEDDNTPVVGGERHFLVDDIGGKGDRNGLLMDDVALKNDWSDLEFDNMASTRDASTRDLSNPLFDDIARKGGLRDPLFDDVAEKKETGNLMFDDLGVQGGGSNFLVDDFAGKGDRSGLIVDDVAWKGDMSDPVFDNIAAKGEMSSPFFDDIAGKYVMSDPMFDDIAVKGDMSDLMFDDNAVKEGNEKGPLFDDNVMKEGMTYPLFDDIAAKKDMGKPFFDDIGVKESMNNLMFDDIASKKDVNDPMFDDIAGKEGISNFVSDDNAEVGGKSDPTLDDTPFDFLLEKINMADSNPRKEQLGQFNSDVSMFANKRAEANSHDGNSLSENDSSPFLSTALSYLSNLLQDLSSIRSENGMMDNKSEDPTQMEDTTIKSPPNSQHLLVDDVEEGLSEKVDSPCGESSGSGDNFLQMKDFDSPASKLSSSFVTDYTVSALKWFFDGSGSKDEDFDKSTERPSFSNMENVLLLDESNSLAIKPSTSIETGGTEDNQGSVIDNGLYANDPTLVTGDKTKGSNPFVTESALSDDNPLHLASGLGGDSPVQVE